MCLSPHRIQNSGLHHNAGQYYLDVPCGICKECQEVKSIDYFVRAFAIFRSMSADWSCFFCTFTHRPADVPRTDLFKFDGFNADGSHRYRKVFRNVVCFNHELIHRCMKNYVQYYRRLFPNDYHFKDYPSGRRIKIYDKVPKYLITSEFGESENHKHLPHYHAIIFVPRQMDFRQFKEEIEKFWHYGFTKNIKIHKYKLFQRDRSPENCIKYVVKYASKAAGYCPSWLMNKNELIPSLGDWFQIEPRIFTSNGFGDDLEKILTESNYMTNKITLSVAGKYVSYNIPYYYTRKYNTISVVDASWKEKVMPLSYPFRVVSSKMLYRKVQHTEYINNYLERKKNVLKELLSKNWFNTRLEFLDMDAEFQDYLCRRCSEPGLLRDIVISTTPEFFVDSFLKFNWSDTPVYTFDYDHVSVPTFDVINPFSRFTYSFCQLYELGFMPDSAKKSYDMTISRFKNLPDKINCIYLRTKSNRNQNGYNCSSSDPIVIDRFHFCSLALDICASYSRFKRENLKAIKKRDEERFYNTIQ